MHKVALALALVCLAAAAEDHTQPPAWVMRGIAAVETSSWWDANGRFIYQDRRRGAAGERGPFQMTRIAFRQIAKGNERAQFWRLETDVPFAYEMSRRYLCWLYRHSACGDWGLAVQKYNAGPAGFAPSYLRRVIAAGSVP